RGLSELADCQRPRRPLLHPLPACGERAATDVCKHSRGEGLQLPPTQQSLLKCLHALFQQARRGRNSKHCDRAACDLPAAAASTSSASTRGAAASTATPAATAVARAGRCRGRGNCLVEIAAQVVRKTDWIVRPT